MLHLLSCLLSLLQSWHFLHLSLSSVTVLKSTDQLFCRVSLKLTVWYILIIISLKLCVFGKAAPEVLCPLQFHIRGYMLSICLITGDLNLDLLVKVLSAVSLHCIIVIFPYVIKNILEETLLEETLLTLCRYPVLRLLPTNFSIHLRILSLTGFWVVL